MKQLLVLFFIALLVIVSGCSDQKSESEADKKDHVLRQQIDAMHDANDVTQALNQKTKEQDAQAEQTAGH